MFGWSEKEKTSSKIKQATSAALKGSCFSARDAAAFGLNDEASSTLYYEVVAHQINSLSFMVSILYGSRAWCNLDFFGTNVGAGLIEAETELNIKPSMVVWIWRRFSELQLMPKEEAADGGQARSSAAAVKKLDSKANESSIMQTIEAVVYRYDRFAGQIFGIPAG